MRGFFTRMFICAFGLWLAAALVPGVSITGVGTLLAAAFLLGVVNAIIRPVLIFLTLPITLLTLGIFLLVINAGMLGLVARLLGDFSISGFLPAMFGSIIVSLTGWFASGFIGDKGRVQVIYTRRDRRM